MAQPHLFLTELVGLSVFDLKRRRIGKIKDAAIVPVIDPSRVDRFLIGAGDSWLALRHDKVRSISLDGIHLADEQLTPYHADEYMLRLVRDLLDQQIIDAQGRKVVRVTDVTFEIHNVGGRDELRISEVDIGMRSVFRRVFQGVLPRRWIRRLHGPIPPHSIPWQLTDILEPDPQRRLRLNITYKHLEEMHPADLADIVEELSPEDREAIFETIPSDVAAEALPEVEPEIQASILESLETGKAAEIIEEMSPAEAADALSEMEESAMAGILGELKDEPKSEVEELLEFREDTAGGMMDTDYVALPAGATAAEALAQVKANAELMEGLNVILLEDESGRLAGVVPIARLLAADPLAPLASLAGDELIRADTSAKAERITELFDKYNLITLPVTHKDGRLAGVITADDVISVLRSR
jgi:sporulation protein YlmC with PRC-barrel domain/CBS domain-containing protein